MTATRKSFLTLCILTAPTAALVFHSCSSKDEVEPTPEPDPVITSFTPTEGLEGESVVIAGLNFSTTPASNMVTFAGAAAVVTASTANSLTTTVPTGASSGTISVTVGGKTAVSANAFTVIGNPPVITDFYPDGGSPGIMVTIVGANFSSVTSQNVVKVNGNNAVVNSVSTTKLVIVIPSGTTGKIAVTVGSETVTSADEFEYFLNATKASGTSFVGCNGSITDASGSTFVTGAFLGTATFGGTNVTSDGLDDGFVAKYNPDLSLAWVRRFGGASHDAGYDVALDADGNVYVVGVISATATFGALTPISPASSDAFVTKLNGSGTFQWVKSFGDYGSSIAIQGDYVYTTGSFSGTSSFGGIMLTSAGDKDIFLAKQDRSNGNVTNAYKFGGTFDDSGQAIALDVSGNIYIGGSFFGSITLGTTTLNAAGMWDGFLVKVDASAAPQWAKQYGGALEDNVYSIGIDAAGNGYAAGYFTSTANMAGTSVTASGNSDAFVAKFPTSTGVPEFVKKAGGNNYEEVRGMALNATGSLIYLTGHIASATAFGDFSLSASSRDVFVAVMDASGDFKWASSGGSTESDNGYGVGVDAVGNIYVAGYFRNNPGVFGGTSVSNTNGIDAMVIWRSKLILP